MSREYLQEREQCLFLFGSNNTPPVLAMSQAQQSSEGGTI